MTDTCIEGPAGPVVAVVGPTATGKSDLAVAIARRLGGEIVNADSMQLYRGMDIGTAKLAPDERGGIRHHLLDIWPLTKSAAVAEYQTLARAQIADLHSRGVIPILVGGSGLYLRGTLDRLDFPGESPEIRTRLAAELDALGVAAMHGRLAGLDPVAAENILPSNSRRVVRALEVIELTGRPFVATMPPFESIYRTVEIGLDRDDLDDRVERRVELMMAAGFLDEVRGLLAEGLAASPTAAKALGYQQLLAVLDGDRVVGDLDDAVAQTVRGTKRFVRRQRSWFRRDPRIRWLDGADPDLVAGAMAEIEAVLGLR
ncbi:tRNA (adenosine(37)-N6)-dimethylallyltransferase MiaA [Jatrophihabitans telluris]|uniref:tRNA dimethylallyltransferase n=1 Tax=Jatrophihabitans telluris TaxID=2038343 RepID=A0ABY4QUT7_9ACTN|nr:tRNA (adenosine(37)-N6)-dimethylallyltransferase MiaA [Jatrophihabitans telluris]UQX86739.1 tRNA (adenosine(37)-N6)-dimethylallyltransferase MiaA [Jatrophihabitans telluris]